MKHEHDPDNARDHDTSDAPPGTDPCIRQDRGREWFHDGSCWWQVGTLPPAARRAYLIEQARRDRAERELI